MLNGGLVMRGARLNFGASVAGLVTFSKHFNADDSTRFMISDDGVLSLPSLSRGDRGRGRSENEVQEGERGTAKALRPVHDSLVGA